MKILHTADWHLGQTFNQKSRKEEHVCFINWLLNEINAIKIDVVIIAGDIFDGTNPTIEAMNLYHDFLLKTYALGIEVVIVGGNHDSASRLNTTGGILKHLNVHVVGGDDSLGEIIPLTNKSNNIIEAVVIAVPYLRDGDLRRISEGENIIEAHQKFALSIKKHYDHLLEIAAQKYPNVPIIGTAHLYVTGCTLSDPENDTMHAIGTLGQIPSSSFSGDFTYMALGHIHKPQIINHPEKVIVKYAGSPIFLSFSERADQKEITILEINNNLLTVDVVHIPLFRALKRFKGNDQEIYLAIEQFEFSAPLPSWIEIIITSPTDFNVFNEKIKLVCELKNIEILSRQLQLQAESNKNIREQYHVGIDNNPLEDVEQIFKLRCDKMGLNDENFKEIKPLFDEILTIVKNV